jgi:hypothetical protein
MRYVHKYIRDLHKYISIQLQNWLSIILYFILLQASDMFKELEILNTFTPYYTSKMCAQISIIS